MVVGGDRADRRERFGRAACVRVKYGCSQTRSRSPAVSGPGLSQIALEIPRRPKVVREARPPERHDIAVGHSQRDAGAALRSATAARMAEEVGRLEVDEVRRRPPERVSKRSPVTTTGSRVRPRSRGPSGRRSRGPRMSSARRRTASGQLRSEQPAAGLPGERARALDTVQAVCDLDELRELTISAMPAGPHRPRARAASPAVPGLVRRHAARRAHARQIELRRQFGGQRGVASEHVVQLLVEPAVANATPTRSRCSGGLAGPEPAHLRWPSLACWSARSRTCRTSARRRRRTASPARARRCDTRRWRAIP